MKKFYYLKYTIIFKILLDICFNQFIIPLWDGQYGQFYYMGFSIYIYILGWVIFFGYSLLINSWFKNINPMKIVLQYIFFISFVPFCTMVSFSSFDFFYVEINTIFFLIIYFFSKLKVFSRNTNIKYNNMHINFLGHWSLILIVSIVTFILAYHSNFRIDLNIKNVYILRNSVKDYNLPNVLTYFIGLSRILIPFLIIYNLKNKNIIIFIYLIVLVLLNYSFDGGKTVFIISILSILTALTFNKKYINKIPFSFCTFMIIGTIEYLFFRGYIFLFITRRLFFVPNLINYYFYDFMKINSPNLYMQIFRFLNIEGTYFNINYEIGKIYFNLPLMSANSGLISEALWQMSYIGIILYPLMIISIIKFANNILIKLNPEYYIIPTLTIAYYLNNSGFLPFLFTHGILLFLIIFSVFYKLKIIKEVS